MKFELDHRTGHMMPKKDENIYFAKSMGGGLIVDDKKNRVKFIIERDGRVTLLFEEQRKASKAGDKYTFFFLQFMYGFVCIYVCEIFFSERQEGDLVYG